MQFLHLSGFAFGKRGSSLYHPECNGTIGAGVERNSVGLEIGVAMIAMLMGLLLFVAPAQLMRIR
jgi:hypothetical protein